MEYFMQKRAFRKLHENEAFTPMGLLTYWTLLDLFNERRFPNSIKLASRELGIDMNVSAPTVCRAMGELAERSVITLRFRGNRPSEIGLPILYEESAKAMKLQKQVELMMELSKADKLLLRQLFKDAEGIDKIEGGHSFISRHRNWIGVAGRLWQHCREYHSEDRRLDTSIIGEWVVAFLILSKAQISAEKVLSVIKELKYMKGSGDFPGWGFVVQNAKGFVKNYYNIINDLETQKSKKRYEAKRNQ